MSGVRTQPQPGFRTRLISASRRISFRSYAGDTEQHRLDHGDHSEVEAVSFGRRYAKRSCSTGRLAGTIVIPLIVSAISVSFAKINRNLVMSSSRSFASHSKAEIGEMTVAKYVPVINFTKYIESSSLASKCLNYVARNPDIGEGLFLFGAGSNGNSRTTSNH